MLIHTKLFRRRCRSVSAKPRRKTSSRIHHNRMESLEQRIVLSGANVAAAQADVTAKQAALQTAINNFETNIQNISSNLDSQMQSDWTDFDSAVNGAGGIQETFESDIATIDSNLTTTLQGRDVAFASAVDPFESTLELALDAADLQLSSDLAAASSTLNGSLQTAQNTFDSSVATADATLASTESAEWAIWDGAFQTAEADLDGDIAAAQATMDGSVAGAQAIYDGAEAGFWTSFETNTGDTPGNLGDTYNTNVASELATRQAVEAANPNVTYDTSNLYSDPGYWTLISSADATFDSNMQTHENDFDSNVQQHQSDFDNNMAGHTASYDSAIDAANTAWDTAVYGVGGAQETYDNSTSAAENIYSTAVYGVGGIQEVYDGAISSSENQLAADIATAEATYVTTLVPAVSAYESTVAQAQQDYDDWLNGTAAGTSFSQQITVVATDYFDPATPDKWVTTTTITAMPSGETTVTVRESRKPVSVSGTQTGPPTVVTTATATITTTNYSDAVSAAPAPGVRMNVYELALYSRTEAFNDEMQTLADDYATDVQLLQQTYDGAVQTAYQTYNTAVHGSGGFAEIYNNAVTSASQGWDTDAQNAQNTFSTLEMNFWMNWNMIDPMDPLQQGVKDYQLAIHDANLTYIGAIGGPLVTYATQEAGQQTQLVRDLIQAGYDFAEGDADLKLAMSQQVIDASADYLSDVVDINSDFAIADSEKVMQYQQTVAGAEQGYLTAQNTAAQTRGKDVAQAGKDDGYRQAAALETYLDDLAYENKVRSKAYSDAGEIYANDVALADHDWIDAEAAAYKDVSKDWNSEIEDLQNDVTAEYVDLMGDHAAEVVTWTGTVAGGVEGIMTSQMGGGADAAAVAAAWKAYDINVTNEWQTFSNGVVGEMQTYVSSESAAWKTAADSGADAAETYETQVADDLKDYVASVAGADKTYSHSMSDAYEIHVQDIADADRAIIEDESDAYKIYGDAEVDANKDMTDSYLAASYGFVGSFLPAEQSHIEDVINDVRAADKNRVTKAQTAEAGLLAESDDLHRDGLTAQKAAADDAADEDDPVVTAAADLEVAQAKLSEELAKQETCNRSLSDFDTWIGYDTLSVYLDATGAFFSSIGSGIVNMGSGIVNAVVGLIDTVVAGSIDLAFTAYGIYDPYFRWDPLSQAGQGTEQFLQNGGSLQEYYADAGIAMAADTVTLGGYSYYQGFQVYMETGDPTQWQQASGELLLDLVMERAPDIEIGLPSRSKGGCMGTGQCFVAGTPVWMAAQEVVPPSADDPDVLAFGGFALVGVTGMRLIRRRKRTKSGTSSRRNLAFKGSTPDQPIPTGPSLPSNSSAETRLRPELSATNRCFEEMGASPDTQPFESTERPSAMQNDPQHSASEPSSKLTHYAGTAWLVFSLLLGAFIGLRGSADAVVQSQSAVHQQAAIDHIRVGQRVLTAAPEGISLEVDPEQETVAAEAEHPHKFRLRNRTGHTAVDPATWRLVRMHAEQVWEDGTLDDINVETLQPISWLREFGIQPGRQASIPLDLVEMGMEEGLTATVLEVLPCPKIEQGPGKVVLTTVDHLNRDVLELKVRQQDGLLDTIRTTGSHKFYSQTNEAWVSASDLATGESLHGMHGSITVLGSQRVPGTHRVYNMTVEDEHVYRVCSLGVLTHNTNCTDAASVDAHRHMREDDLDLDPHDMAFYGGDGVIYRVPGSGTPSGLPYIGSTDSMPQRTHTANDARDRTQAVQVGSYPIGDVNARRVAEQNAIDDNGGIDMLDNLRNEIRQQ